MAGESVDAAPGPNTCPSSPRPKQAHAFVCQNDDDEESANDEKGSGLPPLSSNGLFFCRWTQDAPPGFKHLRPHPSVPTGNQIPPAGTVFGTQAHPPPGVIFGNQRPYPTEIFDTQPPQDEVVFDSNPSPAAIFGHRPPSPAASFSNYPPHWFNHCLPPMHKCFALASTRVYDKNLRCDRCGGRSDLGWYYRCCHETDARLFESIRNGNEEHFDKIGKMFTLNIPQPFRGPAARQDKLSPLNELPGDQIESLSAPQLAKVLRQHEAAVNTALVDRHGPSIPPADEKPFLMPQVEECRASLCPRCGRAGAGEQQSLLSLDGVLKGDVPPTAAVGFGFRALGGRPVANANIVKNLGLRDPKTGLLPDQKARGQAIGAGGRGVAKNTELVERTVALKVDDAETTDDSEGPKTPDSSLKASDSDEDLVQLYMDSEEDTLANSVQDDGVVTHGEATEI